MRRDSYLRLVKKLKLPPVVSPDNSSTTWTTGGITKNSTIFSLDKDEGKKNLKRISKKLHKMSDEDLRILFSPTDDNFVVDCIIDTIPMINELQQERDNLQLQVSDLAKFNHAREPEFARDRKRLRDTINEVELLKRHVACETMLPILSKLGQVQSLLVETKQNHEKQSENIVDEFLKLPDQKVYDDQKDYDRLIEQYIQMRKEAYKCNEIEKLANMGLHRLEGFVPKPLALNSCRSPIPPRRQKKRVSFNK